MAYKGLSGFVKDLDDKGLLIRIKEYVDPELEIAEITDRFCKLPDGGKALLFENTGTSFPVLTNAFGSDQRVAMALGINSPDEAANDIDALFKSLMSPKHSILDKLKILPTLRNAARWMPVVKSGRGDCQQVIHLDPNLNILPILKSWPFDGGPFITLPMVNTKDPNTGIRNVGMYRMQIFGDKLTGMHWHRHKTGARHYSEYKKRGEHMPIAVALGGDPVYTYAATAPLPDNVDEYLLAGFLRKKRVKLVKGITVDIEVPYDADIVLEGYVDPQEDLIWEGPFGDHTGFYSLADWYPKFHVTCITHKRNAIFPATVVGVPPMEDVYLAKATERIFLSPIKLAMLPEVQDMYLPKEGVAHNIAIVKIEKTYPGQAYKVANSFWGAGQMMFNKIMVVVNSEVNIHNAKDLLRLASSLYEPGRDTLFSKGPLDVLDHSSDQPGFGGKIFIDATEKFPEEKGSVNRIELPDEGKLAQKLGDKRIAAVTKFNTKLLSEGISAIVVGVDKSIGESVSSVAQQIVQCLKNSMPKVIVMVDKDVDLDDLALACWYMAGNVEPVRDCYLLDSGIAHSPCLVVDGTRKSFPVDQFRRDWPNVVASSEDTIKLVDQRWELLKLGEMVKSPSSKFENMQFGESAIVK